MNSSKNLGYDLGTISPHKRGLAPSPTPRVRGWEGLEGGLKWGRNRG